MIEYEHIAFFNSGTSVIPIKLISTKGHTPSWFQHRCFEFFTEVVKNQQNTEITKENDNYLSSDYVSDDISKNILIGIIKKFNDINIRCEIINNK